MPGGARPRIGIDARKIRDGGIGRLITELLARLPTDAPDSDFVAFAHPRDFGALAGLNRELEILPLRARGYNPLAELELPIAARRAGLDLLHMPHYPIPLWVPCRLVVTVHDLIHLRFPRTQLHARYCSHMLDRVRRQADVVLTVSHAVASDLETVAGIEPERLRVVANGVAPSFFESEDIRDEDVDIFARRLHLSRPYAINVTNGLPHKGFDLLLGAMRQIRGLQLVFVGHGSDRSGVDEMIAAAGLGAERVHVLGSVSEREMRLLYRGARLAVVASRYEGFGLPALEAMAAGVPLVATKVGGLPEVVGDAGVLVETESIAPLAQAIYSLAFEMGDGQRDRLIADGRERAKRFSWSKAVRLTAAAYRQALGGSL